MQNNQAVPTLDISDIQATVLRPFALSSLPEDPTVAASGGHNLPIHFGTSSDSTSSYFV
jgi:hypothetical protein